MVWGLGFRIWGLHLELRLQETGARLGLRIQHLNLGFRLAI